MAQISRGRCGEVEGRTGVRLQGLCALVSLNNAEFGLILRVLRDEPVDSPNVLSVAFGYFYLRN